LRDDNAGIALQWPAGLLRRAALEAGRRLATTLAITEPEQVFDLRVAELGALLRGEPDPDGPALADRNKLRRRNEATSAPIVLGTEARPPPMRLLPEPLSSLGSGALACVALLERAEGSRPLDGAGIGTLSYRGRARVAFDPVDAVSRLEAGDVLVVPFTTPA
jgi:pyruvate,water dikinase